MSKFINRTVTLTLGLEELAKDFDYKLEVDSNEDVNHEGYTAKDIRSMKPILPEEFADADQVFPQAVGWALEDAERDSYASAMRKARIEGLKQALEKIDLSNGAEYLDTDGATVSASARITEVEIDEKTEIVTIQIQNPEHLINAVISGRGYFASDLSSTEPSSEAEIKARFHNLNDFFTIYGERKPRGELDSRFSPDVDKDSFNEQLKFRISELSLEDVADAVKTSIEETDLTAQEVMAVATRITSYKATKIKKLILKGVEDQKAFWAETLDF